MFKKNRFDKMEWSGAFGDIGTFIPFVFGLILLTEIDAKGIFFTFGFALIFTGYFFKTPMPVQPMKLITGMAIASPMAISIGMIWGAGFFIGILWLFLAATNVIKYITKWITEPIVYGISLALGISFIIKSTELMSSNWIIAGIALAISVLLYKNRSFPMMFALLIFGALIIIMQTPNFYTQLLSRDLILTLPRINWQPFTGAELLAGIMVLAIPQIPLTIGNAIVAVTRENNTRFPDRLTTERTVTLSQGLINLVSPIFGGIPMCHGVGGLVGHSRYGAKTGGSVIILGVIFISLAVLFSQYIELIMLFPLEIVGVILLFTGIDLALVVKRLNGSMDMLVCIITAIFAMWNMAIAVLIAIVIQFVLQKNTVSKAIK